MQQLGWFGGVSAVIHHTRGAKDEVIYYDIHSVGSMVKQATVDSGKGNGQEKNYSIKFHRTKKHEKLLSNPC